jgi:LPS-assembly protein
MKVIEAIGEVVIAHKQETIYGQTAKFNFGTGDFDIQGDVRFKTKDVSLHGSAIHYNLNTTMMSIQDARMYTGLYHFVAKSVDRISKDVYVAKGVEFSTCQDCPESWSIYGENVEITVNEYVRVTNALLKVNGADLMYIPYIIFPIKKDRSSGILFPVLGSRLGEGLTYQQPWFWAISDDKDLTIAPLFSEKRGGGGSLEYRQAFNQISNLEAFSFFTNDQIYVPGKFQRNEKSGEKYFRYFNNIDAQYFPSLNWSFGVNHTAMKDLDYLADYHPIFGPYITGSEIGTNLNLNGRTNLFEFGLQGTLYNNLLNPDPVAYNEYSKLDPTYVQVLPKIHLSMMPVEIFSSKNNLFNQMQLGFYADQSTFHQNHFEESASILRNAQRVNVIPSTSLKIYDDRRFKLETNYTFDNQFYRFRDKDEDKFKKYAGKLKTEFSFGFDRVFGIARKENVPISKDELSTLYSDPNLINGIAPYSFDEISQTQMVTKESYKHGQEIKLIHHYIAMDGEFGNQKFANQIQESEGWFDYWDSRRRDEARLGENQTKTQIPLENTMEVQWNHILVRKTPKDYNFDEDNKHLKDNFNYANVAYLNLSQGVEVGEDRALSDRLTRLASRLGYNANQYMSLALSDYYFHQEADHILSASMRNDLSVVKLLNDYALNEFNKRKIHTFGIELPVTDEYKFILVSKRDLELWQTIEQKYFIHYTPKNDCWFISFGYAKALNITRISLDFEFNFGEANFGKSLYRLF